MKLLSKLGWWGKKTVDQAVGVTSGAVSVPVLDSPKVFRLVVILGVLALGGSGWLVWNSISDATRIKPLATSNANVNTTPAAELEKLRQRDTDEDTISDYDELFALHTSPYLKDSDSDGASDSAELDANQDPNCPKGKSCTGFNFTTSATDEQGQLTPQFLRQALLTSGVPQTTIDQLNDNDLLNVYQQAISDPNNNEPTTAQPTIERLNNLTAAEIRQMMIDSGMAEEDLKDMDDKTLKEIFQEALKLGTAEE